MTLYDSYTDTDYLETISFIAGTHYVIDFPIYDANKNEINIMTASMVWMLSPYGQPEYRILQKNATISGSSKFVITLEHGDTMGLGGIYLQQVEITDVYQKKYRPAQGIVNIRSAIPVEE